MNNNNRSHFIINEISYGIKWLVYILLFAISINLSFLI